jgi:leader peptidase (prepilin peptidase)/N-methyltransferase
MQAWLVVPLGLVIGSWLGVVIRRFGTGRDGLWNRSTCETCHTPLGAPDLIPLLSFAALRGQCRHCGARIGWFHPAVELAALAIAAAALCADGGGTRLWADAGLGWALLAAAWIDAEHMLLPDVITLPLLIAGLAATWWLAPATLTDHAAAAALGYLGFMLLNAAYRAWRGHDGLGQGDAKLLAAAGAWLGAARLPDELLLAGLIGLAAAALLHLAGKAVGPAVKLPFGPALALACFTLRLTMPAS